MSPPPAPDPVRVAWEALDAGGYGPHGPPHDFRARCPAHDGANRDALHVSAGADQRAVLYCFHGCTGDQIVHALGLQWHDLFLPGHRNNTRRARRRPPPKGMVETILDGFALLDIPVRGMWIADRCPYCHNGGLWLRTTPGGTGVYAQCASGCTGDEVIGALETHVAIAEQKRTPKLRRVGR
jgi:hypothetical protein